MEQKEIIEGNKMIAEFMGWKEAGTATGLFNWMFGVSGSQYMRHPEYPRKGKKFLSAFDYNNDWDLLMPVVEKIESLEDVDFVLIRKTYININRKISIINETFSNPSKIMGRGKTFLETVYSGVVQYVTFYNNQKSNT